MNAPVTRRALLGATAAVGAVGLPITATAEMVIPASDLDAELFALIAQHAAAEVEMHRAGTAFDRATEAFEAAVPSPPDALRWREEDFPRTSLGFGLSTPIKDVEGEERREYQARGVGWLRDRPATTWFVTLAPPLDPECEARRLEILTAWDGCVFRRSRPGIPISSRPPIRREAGHRSDLKPATAAAFPQVREEGRVGGVSGQAG